MHQRQFSLNDQIAFAELSGDFNPLHVDPLLARRLLTGGCAVHGIHALAWAIDQCLATIASPVVLRSIKAKFLRPVLVGQSVSVVTKSQAGGGVALEIRGDSGKLLGGSVRFEAVPRWTDPPVAAHSPPRLPARDLSDADLPGDAGKIELAMDVALAGRLLPNLARCVSPRQIATLLATSRLVGVHCPGLHSLFSELELNSDVSDNEFSGNVVAPADDSLKYAVAEFDPRFHLAAIEVQAPGMSGHVRAFLRPAPQSQPTLAQIRPHVRLSEFAGQQALVVGGSRGLGEVAAKLLAAGGAAVTITYHQGRDEAERIVAEITAGGTVATARQLNVLASAAELSAALADGLAPTHLYYFATPPILGSTAGAFSAELFSRYCAYYVTGFANVFAELRPRGLHAAFYPSSTFVSETPTSMGEYVVAKAAGEALCEFLETAHRRSTIFRPRLGRLATDQTANLLRDVGADPISVLLLHLREFCRHAAAPVLKPDSP